MLFQHLQVTESFLQVQEVNNFCESLRYLRSLTPLLLDLSHYAALAGDNCEVFAPVLTRPLADALLGLKISAHGSLALQLLDSGLPLIFYDYESEENLDMHEHFSSIPRTRSGLTLLYAEEAVRRAIAMFRGSVQHFLVRVTEVDKLEAVLADLVNQLKQVDYSIEIYVSLPSGSISSNHLTKVATMHEHMHLTIEPRLKPSRLDRLPTLLPYMSVIQPTETDILDLFISCIKTDRADGLYTTVVTDEHNRALGLVYSSAESVEYAFMNRRGVYYSRSRGGLWHKGESSGMIQQLLTMRLDCDRDALRFTVIQQGNPPAFCHLMTRSCWGEQHGLQKLEHTLQQRKLNAPAGSYTQKLFNDSNLLRQKLLEEVQELVEAEDKEHIASEAADVMYFMMTRCVAAGVTLSDIERYLDLRSMKINRRPGLAKEWRTKDAEKALQQDGQK